MAVVLLVVVLQVSEATLGLSANRFLTLIFEFADFRLAMDNALSAAMPWQLRKMAAVVTYLGFPKVSMNPKFKPYG